MPTDQNERIEELEDENRLLKSNLARRDERISQLEDDLDVQTRIAERVENLEVDLGVGTAHVAAIDRAIERLARFIADAKDDDDLWVQVGRDDEARVEVASSAVQTLANARDRIVQKPTPKPSR